MTVIWINGTFGAGKTTTAGELVGLLTGAVADQVRAYVANSISKVG